MQSHKLFDSLVHANYETIRQSYLLKYCDNKYNAVCCGLACSQHATTATKRMKATTERCKSKLLLLRNELNGLPLLDIAFRTKEAQHFFSSISLIPFAFCFFNFSKKKKEFYFSNLKLLFSFEERKANRQQPQRQR